MNNPFGGFTISLDFELFWGVRDKRTVHNYSDNLDGVPAAIDAMLTEFEKYEVSATWSTVGLLMTADIEEARRVQPQLKPQYEDLNLSPYGYINAEWNGEYDEYHFAKGIIEKIIQSPRQSIGTHTFSHYYTQDRGQSLAAFKADLTCAKAASPVDLKSIVFPRNQYNDDYVKVLPDFDIHSYRGTEKSWLYKSVGSDDQGLIKRSLRLLDSYINLTGYNTASWEDIGSSYPYNIPSSRFFRPWSKKLAPFDFAKLARIKRAMDYAAKNNEVFHLWWHPHNFGVNIDKNIEMLRSVLEHYKNLNQKHGMRSFSMEEISDLLMNESV
jgi:hypothetical protein